ncbi:MAG: antibiotic biosynthesis monooxygenase [Myxococcales bacterium]|nr:antibiotic biosynthesis monooxygenase [Myxococcales bacterium]MCB9756233.1 antibiotic biosynthesis monooxygenase [Myxococcales bacterium]
MSQVHVINAIEVPEGMESVAIEVREQYVEYFRTLPGFVGSTFYRALDTSSAYTYINVVIWESRAAFAAAVNAGFDNLDGENRDGMRVLGRGFPAPIVVHPGRYEIIAS